MSERENSDQTMHPQDQDSYPPISHPDLTEAIGTQIGSYKLLSVLGEGGFGIVYLAEQKKPVRRQVALKVIKPGMDSKQVIARFEAERQALALLDHPNIAKVFDSGITEKGRLYFAMEYVKGRSVTEFCDHEKLSIEERLHLFIRICEAVQHAHQKGIIHRDIKPSNILVYVEADQPIPKIIDFGIAKALSQPLTERTLFTEQGQLLGTPEYMSPEQAELTSQLVDTRSDIYSLGVVLYELLTGALPFDPRRLRQVAIDEILRTIRDEEPPRPSTRLSNLGEEAEKVAQNRQTAVKSLAKRLNHELEWIPLKAMRKEPDRRYRTATELADDIRHYLKGDALIAGPESRVYHFKKMIKRHRAVVSGTAAVVIVLTVGIVVSTIFYIGEVRARTESQRQTNIAQAVNDFLNNDLLRSVDPSQAKGREVTVREVLDTASEKIKEKFQNEPLVEASIRLTIGHTYKSLGQYETAESHLKRAKVIYQEELGEEHPDTLESIHRLSVLYRDQGQYEEAEPLLSQNFETCKHVFGDEDPNTLNSMSSLAVLYMEQGRYEEAEKLQFKALEIKKRVRGEEHPDTLDSMNSLAIVYRYQNKYEEAEILYNKALEISKRVLKEEHPLTLSCINNLAVLYESQRKYDKAEPLYIKALEISKFVRGNEHPNTLISMINLAGLYVPQKRYKEAEALQLKALEISKRVLKDDHPITLKSMSSLAHIYRHQNRNQEEEALQLKTLESRKRILGEGHPDTLDSMKNLIKRYRTQGRHTEAQGLPHKSRLLRGLEIEKRGILDDETAYPALIRSYETLLHFDPCNVSMLNELAWLLATNPITSYRDGSKAIEKATTACNLTDRKDPSNLDTLAAAYAEMGKFNDAVRFQETAIRNLSEKMRSGTLEECEARLRLYKKRLPYHQQYLWPNQLIAHYTFEQVDGTKVMDSSAHQIDGIMQGNAQIIEDPVRGKVLKLDGAGDWIDCGNDARFDILNQITISSWIKIAKFDKSYQAIIAKGNEAWRLQRFQGTNNIEFTCTGINIEGQNTWEGWLFGAIDVNDNQWHHLVGVYDGRSTILYIDGEQDVSAKASGKIHITENKLLIGALYEWYPREWNGFIDDVRIYSYALSPEEVKKLYEGK
ncbi:tetratricopeptide repeat protein [Planctomycetota bacterium]